MSTSDQHLWYLLRCDAKHDRDCLPPQVREIYEMAVEAEPPYSLSDGDCKTMCVRYAQLETRVRPEETAIVLSAEERLDCHSAPLNNEPATGRTV